MGTAQCRGGQNLATFIISTSLDTTTSLDKLVTIGTSGGVNLVTTVSSFALGEIVETKGTAAVVNLFSSTHRAIAGAALAAGARLVMQTATGYLITATGTLTAVDIYGIAIQSASASGEKFEYMPLYTSGRVIA